MHPTISVDMKPGVGSEREDLPALTIITEKQMTIPAVIIVG